MSALYPTPVSLDPERQKEAKAYARIRHRLLAVEVALSGLYTAAWLLLGWSTRLRAILVGLTTNVWLLVAGFGFVFGAAYYLLELPLSYYAGFVLPHRFHLSTQTVMGWIGDQVKYSSNSFRWARNMPSCPWEVPGVG